MSRFLLEYDDNETAKSATLVLDTKEGYQTLLSKLQQYDTTRYLDLRPLMVIDVWTIINELKTDSELQLIINDDQLNDTLLSSAVNIADIDYKSDAFVFTLGEKSDHILKKYQRLNINIQEKNKSYELQIVESLLREQGKNNEKIAQLQREKQLLEQSSGAINDDELETRYLDLMEKYKQALKRLEQLRESKLGKLQVAYWNKKRGY
ncbi:hypothetical protein LNK15_05525 [Jeotgalicoccus huakuii]|mgnify:CR=1 FL=1|nr:MULTISPECIES: hypothetical protein [Jeotgalicoccus]MCK1976515.1 hypothetical protein [Jeotgalicoccus huakuii]